MPRLEPILTLARDGVAGASPTDRLDLVVSALVRLVPASNAGACVLERGARQASQARLSWILAGGVDWSDYDAEYAASDPHLARAVAGRHGTARTSDLIPSSLWGCEPFSGGYLPRLRLRHSLAGSVALPCGRVLILGIGRGAWGKDFLENDKLVLGRVVDALATGLARVFRLDRLTPRELEVARIVAAGATASEAGEQLGIARNTARVHLANAYRKLGVSERVGLARALG